MCRPIKIDSQIRAKATCIVFIISSSQPKGPCYPESCCTSLELACGVHALYLRSTRCHYSPLYSTRKQETWPWKVFAYGQGMEDNFRHGGNPWCMSTDSYGWMWMLIWKHRLSFNLQILCQRGMSVAYIKLFLCSTAFTQRWFGSQKIPRDISVSDMQLYKHRRSSTSTIHWQTSQRYTGLQWVCILFRVLVCYLCWTLYPKFSVMHPRFKIQYFKEQRWQLDWINTAIDIAREIWTTKYKTMTVVPESMGTRNARQSVCFWVLKFNSPLWQYT